MLRSADIIAGKILVQLALASVDSVRAGLRKVAEVGATGDVVDQLARALALTLDQQDAVRWRTDLYQRVRAETGYARFALQQGLVTPEVLHDAIDEVEATELGRRLGEVLVACGALTPEQDAAFLAREAAVMERDDQRTIERYRGEDFAHVARPLIAGSTALDAGEFRIARPVARPATSERPAEDVAPASAPAATDSFAEVETKEEDAPGRPRRKTELLRAMKRVASYTIVEVLGIGGMGAVLLGQKDDDSVYAAIKVLLHSAATDQEHRRFRREISLTRRVNHPNVIRIIDSGETADGLSYLVVPALVGKDLRAVLDAQDGHGLPAASAVALFEQILLGLAAIHDARIVHRDMKPGNIMVLAGAEPSVKILDLGLARLEGEPDPEDPDANFHTIATVVTGSPLYMAPESVGASDVDRRADVYSMGCMFYEMLTGKTPFGGAGPTALVSQHLTAPPPLLREARPGRDWPHVADDFMARLMAKAPEDRYPGCREVLAALRARVAPALVRADNAGGKAPSYGPRVPVAEGPPITARFEKSSWGVRGLLGRLRGRPR